MNTMAKVTARDTAHHTTTKDTAEDTLHVTTEDTFHTALQPTTQEELSVVEPVVTEEDTTRDVTLQSSTIARLVRIKQQRQQDEIFFVVKF